jgi:bacterioferritin-associated ferredoxin
MPLNGSSWQWTKIVSTCGQCAPAYRQVINSI